MTPFQFDIDTLGIQTTIVMLLRIMLLVHNFLDDTKNSRLCWLADHGRGAAHQACIGVVWILCRYENF